MSISANKEILTHLIKIENQLTMLNSKIDNFLGFEELSEEELEELDRIEEEMEKGNKISLDEII
ncbi:hypothetical protein ANME2D_01912 [Candidatus Methanoperedens nitroreducens]|uniref:Uncharacterized protein n=1 Tax=Candidatus Methanoperedens nitratireducens TaxID=1392998 RepID=A0A062V3D9_9EURY|nr:hypothetical protein [Candidatus Methanoperedens nitroreducens]KCZ71857.1 hypothetical protein ANME2D_01912 [Candidatus Methanoperedens nitroreducens]MDJ1422168.1 hypothetical protein [Candidatus Methanoperedens sp.]